MYGTLSPFVSCWGGGEGFIFPLSALCYLLEKRKKVYPAPFLLLFLVEEEENTVSRPLYVLSPDGEMEGAGGRPIKTSCCPPRSGAPPLPHSLTLLASKLLLTLGFSRL